MHTYKKIGGYEDTGCCNLCESSEHTFLFRSGEYPDSRGGDVVRCSSCGLIYRIGRKAIISQANINNFFEQSSFPDPLNTGKIRMFKGYVELIAGFREKNSILDFGCGEGYFLKLCKDEGWDAWGVEINSILADGVRKKYGVNVFRGSIERAGFPDNNFDVVTLFNVFDYLIDPMRTLREASRLLRPGGGIFLRLPNATFHIKCRRVFASLYRVWKGIRRFDPTTIHSFSVDKLAVTRYLNKAGFTDIAVQNGKLTYAGGNSSNSIIQKIFGESIQGIASTARIVTAGNWLVAPSLEARARKPAKGR